MWKKIFLIILFLSLNRSVLAGEIDYHFPFPGILPDHPFYPLKILRDEIYDFFLTDQLKKAEFKLLTADKRFYMAVMLKEKNKKQLALTTVKQALNYYRSGILLLVRLKLQAERVDTLQDKFLTASWKYEEILRGWQKEQNKEQEDELRTLLELLKKYQQELLEI